MRVAFLGMGRMGAAMARHVLDAGHELTVWNRTPGKAGHLVEAGATEAKSAGEATSSADVVVLMLFGPDSVREVLPEVVREGVLVVDGTTIGPEAAREFGRTARKAGARYADAPVAGSIGPATEGTLGVLVGCAPEDWDDVRPVVELWGDPARVIRVGEVGAGSALKVVVNQSIGVLSAGLGEALRLASTLGLDRSLVLAVLGSTGYGFTLKQKQQMIEAGDYTDTHFSLDLLAKDLDLALKAASSIDLEVTAAVRDVARRALDAGHSGEDYAALIGHLADEGEADSH